MALAEYGLTIDTARDVPDTAARDAGHAARDAGHAARDAGHAAWTAAVERHGGAGDPAGPPIRCAVWRRARG